MQANYPKKLSTIHWDTLNIEYPVRQFVPTGSSSEATARRWGGQPEIIKNIGVILCRNEADGRYTKFPIQSTFFIFGLVPGPGPLKQPYVEEVDYSHDYTVTKELTRSQSAVDLSYKMSDRFRVNKHTPWSENQYIYPPSRKVSDRVPSSTAHASTEMSRAYKVPATPSRLVTDKDQYKQLAGVPLAPPKVTPFHKELEPLDTTYEGFEKYLDPYLTTNRLYHRPYTAHELTTLSNSRDILTYYTYADIPWVRVPRPKTNVWGLPLSRPKTMYDREKFKEDFREIKAHNKLRWVPGTFRTETRDNYVQQTARPEAQIHNEEEEVRTLYQRKAGQLPTNILQEDLTKQCYSTENSIIGSRKPTCAVLDPFNEKNKRLAGKSF